MKVDKFTDQPCPTCGTARSIVNPTWLRAARESAKLGLRQLADKLGYSAPYLSDVERGRRNCTPRVRKAYEALKAQP